MDRWIIFLPIALGAVLACSGDKSPTDRTPTGKEGKGGVGGAGGASGVGGSSAGMGGSRPKPAGADGGDSGKCVNLQCRQQPTCPGGGSTTVSGTVYDPAGNNPLYNIVVYVPNEPVAEITHGATCESCEELYSGRPIAVALTDAAGNFTLSNAPEGADVPLVVQVGKWRRQFVLPEVVACQDNPQPDGVLRLPRNRTEGDIPTIAVSTGAADTLECLMRRIGLDASEYGPGGSDTAVQIYPGTRDPRVGIVTDLHEPGNTNPPAASSPTALWNTADALMPYDIVLLSCEGQETQSMNQQALHDYASAGGRVFASHFHYAWLNSGPYGSENLATWTPGANSIGDIQGTIVTTLSNGMPFPKGVALQEWLTNVGALQNGTLPITDAKDNADVSASNTPSQPWIVADSSSRAPGATQYFSFNTPTDAAATPDARACGRVVFSDLHVGAASGDDVAMPVPDGCATGPLSPQEAALEFMLFDLSSCVVPDDVPPMPPIIE